MSDTPSHHIGASDHLDPLSADFMVAAAERVADAYPDLFRHQTAGVAFLLSRQRAILADDMGLGKTRTAIVAAREQAPDGPFLVVCPMTVKFTWEREIHVVEPGVDVQVVGAEPIRQDARWVIVNYDRLTKHLDDLLARRFAVVVLDEAHYVKNRSAKRAKAALRLVGAADTRRASRTANDAGQRSDAVYLLTGTPMANRPRDLFNLLRAIDHPLGHSYTRYAKRYCAAHHNGYGLVDDGASNLDELALLLSGVMLRRTKDEELDLPPKVRTWLPLDLPVQRVAALERRALDYLVANPARSGPTWTTFLGQLNKARHELALVKARAGVDFVTDCVDAGQKVVVFTQYSAVVKAYLERFGSAAVTITGDTTARARTTAVDRFQRDADVRVLVGNIHAAGTGITLTSGSHVVFNDLDWVPANHWQAEDRIYRIGQTQTAFATYLYTPGTLDGYVARLLESKAAMIDIVESRAEEHASIVGDVVSMVLDGIDDPVTAVGTVGTADAVDPDRAPPRTMGLLEETLELLEQFGRADMAAQCGVQRFEYPSGRDPNIIYTVEVVNGVAHCDCRGFEYGGHCWHLRDALQRGAQGG